MVLRFVLFVCIAAQSTAAHAESRADLFPWAGEGLRLAKDLVLAPNQAEICHSEKYAGGVGGHLTCCISTPSSDVKTRRFISKGEYSVVFGKAGTTTKRIDSSFSLEIRGKGQSFVYDCNKRSTTGINAEMMKENLTGMAKKHFSATFFTPLAPTQVIQPINSPGSQAQQP